MRQLQTFKIYSVATLILWPLYCSASATHYLETKLIDATERCDLATIKETEESSPGLIRQNSVQGSKSAIAVALEVCADQSIINYLKANNGLSSKGYKGNQLHAAVRARTPNLNIIKELVSLGANLNELDKDGLTVLGKAAEFADLPTIQYLVQSGAKTPNVLPSAYNRNDDRIYFYLLDSGIAPYANFKLMKIASSRGHFRIIKSLLEEGVKITKENLRDAIISGNLAPNEIEHLLPLTSPLDSIDLLHAAAESRRLDVFNHFYKKFGINLNDAINDQGKTVLHSLAQAAYYNFPKGQKYESLELAILFKKLGLDLHKKDLNGENALDVVTFATANTPNGPDLALIKFLLENDLRSITAVRWSIIQGEISRFRAKKREAFKLLSSYGIDWPKFLAIYGRSDVLETMIKRGMPLEAWFESVPQILLPDAQQALEYVHLLLKSCRNKSDYGVELKSYLQGHKKNFTFLIEQFSFEKEELQKVVFPLLFYSRYCFVNDQLEYLVNKKGVDFQFVDERGNSPLSAALYREASEETIQLIIDNDGLVLPLYYNGRYEGFINKLYKKKKFSAIKKIIEKENDLYQKGVPTSFLLELHDMFRFSSKVDPVLEFMIESGANINAQDQDWNTALHFAVNSDNKKLVEYLVNKKSLLSLQNKKCETPLHLAVQNGSLEIAQYLLAQGATIKSCPNEVQRGMD